MTGLKKPVVRETTEIDYRTNKPLVIKLEQGGKLVKTRIKGERTWYTVTIKEIHMLGAKHMADEIRREKARKKAAKKAETEGKKKKGKS